ncbi:hypothetical protein [Murinocardiopsis flavida]|uniref:hypothetical protein n=1 Tax=Murinocardiopsis flavida TaxID=645275 RepID=UPI001B7FFCE3|nr:hypothetical protein [Murinocardiopsis flavida]
MRSAVAAAESDVPVRGRPAAAVLPALRTLVPELPAGSLVSVAGGGSASLAAALVAGASEGGAWCAVVGVPEFGVRSAVGMGADPQRLLLVDDPGRRWAETVAALAEGVGLVLTRAPAPVAPALARRLTSVARRHGCVLVVAGTAWEGTWLRLEVTASVWTGLAQGHGHLRGRRATVAALGRGAGGGRRAALWLPGPDGAVGPDRTAEAPQDGGVRPVRAAPRTAGTTTTEVA